MVRPHYVKELWLADVPGVKRHPYIRRLVRRVRMHGGRVRWLQRGDIIHLGQVTGKVLWPPAGFAPNNPNNASLVLSLQLPHGKRLLLPGDIEAEAETGMLADHMQAQAIMLMPHHGSTSSSTTAFIRATMPEWAIAQSGYANRYGFPKPQVVQRYKHVGAQVRNTAHGAVIVTQGDKGDMHVTYAKPVRSDKRSDILQWWQRRL